MCLSRDFPSLRQGVAASPPPPPRQPRQPPPRSDRDWRERYLQLASGVRGLCDGGFVKAAYPDVCGAAGASSALVAAAAAAAAACVGPGVVHECREPLNENSGHVHRWAKSTTP